MATSQPQTDLVLDPELCKVFKQVEDSFKRTELGDKRWYILTIACLAASPDPEAAKELYLYIVRKPEYEKSEARQELVRRLREALVKSVPLVGVCKPLEAILAIMEVERPEDQDLSCTREGWQADQTNHERAVGWFRQVYTRNANDTIGLFDAHKDFAWISTEITYGLYLSDRQVLDDTETQLVVLPAIMSQNLRTETHWHIRGTRRIGVSKNDVQVIWDAVQAIAAFYEVKLTKVPTVDEVEPDV
ncbi:hypothetical protein EDB81DRAFT_353758 [Dactylonectria macrodidyma]|uniref:Uncharacterized protein n=1 Tax=Dactylonectria macrodidyma TaxID=307937 RepID=A0A9P9FI30_9HYPO|nr:hypothetical protein EDB81DRAFT_353758 [Dactylonectria macrodidyma]